MKLLSFQNAIHVIVFILLFPLIPCQAAVPDMPKLTVNNFNTEVARIHNTHESLTKNTSKALLRKFKKAKGNFHYRFTKEQTILKNDYQKISAQKYLIDPVYELRETIKKMYLKYYSVSEKEEQELDHEATRLALGLFEEIERLKDKYNTFFLPVIHNMLIDVRLKKRGACKHWAEDLLTFLKPLPRKFFDVTWGEAYPGQIMEHNTAVLIPKGRPFEDGLFIDPWRTAGRPYWLPVTKDEHYHWKQWAQYGRY